MDAPATHGVLHRIDDCMHRCLCKGCGERLVSDAKARKVAAKCPMCQQAAERLIRVWD